MQASDRLENSTEKVKTTRSRIKPRMHLGPDGDTSLKLNVTTRRQANAGAVPEKVHAQAPVAIGKNTVAVDSTARGRKRKANGKQTVKAAPVIQLGQAQNLPELLATLKQQQELVWQCARDAEIATTDTHIKRDGRRPPPIISVGDHVMVSSRTLLAKSKHPAGRKISGCFMGPYLVVEKVGRKAYRVRLPQESKAHDVFNVMQLKRFVSTTDFPTRPPAPQDTQENLLDFIVEDIIGHKRKNKQLMLHTLWLGYPREQASWEPISNFIDADNTIENTVVRDYFMKHGLTV
jgi:hypothetical protein